MIDLIYKLPGRSFFITCGAVLSIAVMVIMIITEYRFTLRMLIISAAAALCSITSGIGGMTAKKLALGEWLDMGDFFRRINAYEGTHYIGRVLYIVITAHILWKLIMRSDNTFDKQSFNKGTFDKQGFGGFIGILSIYMIIQCFICRIGCLPAGCCYGKPYTGIFAVRAVTIQYTVYPAVYAELLGLFITLILSLGAYFKKNTFRVFGIGYSVSIFIAEFMYDQTGHVMICGLSAVQILALLLAVMCCTCGRKETTRLSSERKRSVDK